ncbi:putative Aluminum activated malate transporter family protein [Melia azedarach]|uniref:Aluminum activated malate transporter family protein n=1 Tax=Melia azedarach TaxID=155640 RepID=A0ACC1YVW1_MELAZ|nr:putative Aluminum activated malate transporter family protein [Melia azedarach]
MGSTVITIPVEENQAAVKEKKKFQDSLPIICFLREMKSKHDTRKLTHSIKVGIALVLVSLLYLLDPLYKQVGENAMWAIMTVVVIFEFYAGATLSKGLNRGVGTILGGGLGCLAAAFAQEVGGIGNGIIVGISVFIFGVAATYSRLVPKIKKRYDYGVMIFILTFNLVAVSGLRAEKVMQLARERLSTIVMGFSVCIFTSLLVFPIWAGDELHDSLTSRFEDLARSIEGCLEEYFKFVAEKEKQSSFSFSPCKSVLHSKSKDELLANFARWEPWHGKFGFSYPWGKYLKIGEVLRDMAANMLSFKGYLHSSTQSSQDARGLIKEPCEVVGSSLAWTLRELGESIKKMRKCETTSLITPKLKSMRQELSQAISPSTLGELENSDGIEIASFVFSLMEIVDKVEELTKEVEELGERAGFHANK